MPHTQAHTHTHTDNSQRSTGKCTALKLTYMNIRIEMIIWVNAHKTGQEEKQSKPLIFISPPNVYSFHESA